MSREECELGLPCEEEDDLSVLMVTDYTTAHPPAHVPASLGGQRPSAPQLPGGQFPHHVPGSPFSQSDTRQSQQMLLQPRLERLDASHLCLESPTFKLDETIGDVLMSHWLRWHWPPERPSERRPMLDEISRFYRDGKVLDLFDFKSLLTAFFRDGSSYQRPMPAPDLRPRGKRTAESLSKWLEDLDDCVFRLFLLYAEVWCFLDGTGKRPKLTRKRSGRALLEPLQMQPRSTETAGNSKRQRKHEKTKVDRTIIANDALLEIRKQEVKAEFQKAFGEPLTQNNTQWFFRAVSRKLGQPLGHYGGRHEGWAWLSTLDVPSYEAVLCCAMKRDSLE